MYTHFLYVVFLGNILYSGWVSCYYYKIVTIDTWYCVDMDMTQNYAY